MFNNLFALLLQLYFAQYKVEELGEDAGEYLRASSMA